MKMMFESPGVIAGKGTPLRIRATRSARVSARSATIYTHFEMRRSMSSTSSRTSFLM